MGTTRILHSPTVHIEQDSIRYYAVSIMLSFGDMEPLFTGLEMTERNAASTSYTGSLSSAEKRYWGHEIRMRSANPTSGFHIDSGITIRDMCESSVPVNPS
jgi:hypothetical protein